MQGWNFLSHTAGQAGAAWTLEFRALLRIPLLPPAGHELQGGLEGGSGWGRKQRQTRAGLAWELSLSIPLASGGRPVNGRLPGVSPQLEGLRPAWASVLRAVSFLH